MSMIYREEMSEDDLMRGISEHDIRRGISEHDIMRGISEHDIPMINKIEHK